LVWQLNRLKYSTTGLLPNFIPRNGLLNEEIITALVHLQTGDVFTPVNFVNLTSGPWGRTHSAARGGREIQVYGREII
jgi:hypothetical protein